jgi:hypothetical protein
VAAKRGVGALTTTALMAGKKFAGVRLPDKGDSLTYLHLEWMLIIKA